MALIDDTKLIVHADNNWDDSSDNPATPSPLGATFISPGKLGSHEGAFDGVDDNVDYGNPAKLQITSTLTLATWVKRRADQYQKAIVWKANAYGLGFGSPLGGGPNQPAFSIYDGGWKVALSPNTIDNIDSHLLVGTYDGSTLRLFVDDILKAETTWSGNIGSSAYLFSIGSYELTGGGRGWYTNSLIDETVVWNRAISYGGVSVGQQATGEVAELWNGGAGVEVVIDGVTISLSRGRLINSDGTLGGLTKSTLNNLGGV